MLLSFLNSLQIRGLSFYVIAFLFFALTISSFYIAHQKNVIKDLVKDLEQSNLKISLEQINTQNALLMLDTQSSQLQNLRIDNENLMKSLHGLDQALQKRLSKIKVPLSQDTCDSKLTYYEAVLSEFNNE